MESIEITGLLPEHIAAFMAVACANKGDSLCFWIDELAKANWSPPFGTIAKVYSNK